MHVAMKLAFVFLTTIVTITKTASAKEVTGTGEINFQSEKNLRVTFKSKSKDYEGRCQREIKFTFPMGPTIDPVFVECVDNADEENDGNEFLVGKVLYSPDPKQLFVITNTGKCVLYFDNNGDKGGPQEQKDEVCKSIKAKLRGSVNPLTSLWTGVKRFLNAINPVNWSSSSSRNLK